MYTFSKVGKYIVGNPGDQPVHNANVTKSLNDTIYILSPY